MPDQNRSRSTSIASKGPLVLFVLALMAASVAYGIAAGYKNWFPVPQLREAKSTIGALRNGDRPPKIFSPTSETSAYKVADISHAAPGLTKLVEVEGDNSLAVKVVTLDGREVHRWRIEWNEIWPDVTHIRKEDVPHVRPGTFIHGADIQPNGDLVFNFEHLAMQRLDACGHVKWRLPVRTHHSIFKDEQGNFWVPGLDLRFQPPKGMPFYRGAYDEPSVLKISPEGQVLERWSLFDILQKSGLTGALYGTTKENREPIINGDTLHLNDIEVFPSTMTPGLFKAGDVMLSIRNVNGVFVFDPADNWRLKFSWADRIIRQHDPDFMDGDHITILDNHNITTRELGGSSKVVKVNAVTRQQEIVFEGTPAIPFFTPVMGKHQWLSNGNLLISESVPGRVIEVTPQHGLAWEYLNLSGDGYTGIVSGVERLKPDYDENFFAEARARCAGSPT